MDDPPEEFRVTPTSGELIKYPGAPSRPRRPLTCRFSGSSPQLSCRCDGAFPEQFRSPWTVFRLYLVFVGVDDVSST